MFHACVERFDVMGGRGNIFGLGWEVNKAFISFFFFSFFTFCFFNFSPFSFSSSSLFGA
jgi:hypothetical protein